MFLKKKKTISSLITKIDRTYGSLFRPRVLLELDHVDSDVETLLTALTIRDWEGKKSREVAIFSEGAIETLIIDGIQYGSLLKFSTALGGHYYTLEGNLVYCHLGAAKELVYTLPVKEKPTQNVDLDVHYWPD